MQNLRRQRVRKEKVEYSLNCKLEFWSEMPNLLQTVYELYDAPRGAQATLLPDFRTKSWRKVDSMNIRTSYVHEYQIETKNKLFRGCSSIGRR